MLLSHEQQYRNAWADLRRRGYVLAGTFLGSLPGVPLLLYGINLIHPVDIVWIGGGWAAVFAGAAMHRSTFPCPRCGQWFFVNFFHNPLARKCMHCGLKIGAPYDAPHASG